MPEPEQNPGAQGRSLKDYWINPPYPTSRRREHIGEEGSLFSVPHELTLQAEIPHEPAMSATPKALPLTWYGTETTPAVRHPLSQLQHTVEQRGVDQLGNVDLLTLVLRTPAAKADVVTVMNSLLTSYTTKELLNIEFGELARQLGEAQAAKLQGILELSRRLTLPSTEEKYTIKSPRDAAMLLSPEMAHLDHEEMRVLVLSTKNQVVANLLLFKGTVNSSVLRAAEIFRPAVTRNCPGVIISHNHPSGDPTPSPEDLAVTRQLVEAGKVMDIDLVDHIIIGHNDRFTSLKEQLMW